MEYTPDVWVVVKLTRGTDSIYKVLAGWYGGYLGSNSWQLNSGIKAVTLDGQLYLFEGFSGSVYRCHREAYRTSITTAGVLQNTMKYAEEDGIVVELLPDDYDFLSIKDE